MMARDLAALALMVALGACGGPPPAAPAEGEASTGSGDDTSSSGLGMTSAPDSVDSGSSSSSSSSGPMTEDTTEGCALAELGAACEDPRCDCASGHCFVVEPLGGVCSECDEDADCEEGGSCDFGNPLTMTPAICSRPPPPRGACETADDCPKGQFCPTVIEVPGILSAATCSECEGDMGCMDGEICTPTYDIENIAGYYACVAPGSVPDDEGCNLEGDGSECASGQCALASLMGIPVVAVCSPCNEDGDCGGGQTCQPPELVTVDEALELVPGACV